MRIKFIQSIGGPHFHYKAGDVVEWPDNADSIAEAKRFIEHGIAAEVTADAGPPKGYVQIPQAEHEALLETREDFRRLIKIFARHGVQSPEAVDTLLAEAKAARAAAGKPGAGTQQPPVPTADPAAEGAEDDQEDGQEDGDCGDEAAKPEQAAGGKRKRGGKSSKGAGE